MRALRFMMAQNFEGAVQMRLGQIGLFSLFVAALAGASGPAAAQVNNNGYTFIDVLNPTDPTFTQLLGISDNSQIAGYYGCGTLPNHPNKGFSLLFINSKNGPFTGNPSYTAVNFPGSVQDQNFGVNDLNNPTMAGFWQDNNMVDHGYVDLNGTFVTLDAPGTTTFGNQILGLDDNNDVAGFNTNAGGTTFAEYELVNPAGGTPTAANLITLTPAMLAGYGVTQPIVNTMGTGVNPGFAGTTANPGKINLVSGFNMPTTTTSNAFVLGTPQPGGRRGTSPIATNIPAPGGSTFVQALGVNQNGLAVGTYTDVNGVMHGFTYSLQTGIFTTVDDPNANFNAGFGVTINGINTNGQIVGFYTNGKMTNPPCNDTIGFVAYPQTNAPPAPLLASILPGSRTVTVGTTATIFATVINTGTTTVSGCAPSLGNTAPTSLTLSYAPTNPSTNQINGPQNTPVSIAGNNGAASFVLAFSSTKAGTFPALPITFACTSVQNAPVYPGLTTLNLAFTAAKTEPDMVALAATDPSTPGICAANYTNNTPGDFAVATINLGAAGTVTATPITGAIGLPLSSLTVCQTNSQTGACLATPAASTTLSVAANATPTFGIFMSANNAIPLNPGAFRVGLQFTDPNTGALVGSTNVAMQAQ
jgi:hypothetical protein